MATTVTVRRVPVVLVAAAVAVLVAASQALWGMWRAAIALTLTPQHFKWLLAGVALCGLAAAGPVVRRFPVPGPPRPRYGGVGTIGVTGWGPVGILFIAPGIATAVGALFDAPVRDPHAGDASGVVARFVDDVLAPALWEELLWRVLVFAVVLRVAGPRLAVVLQAVSFAVAHTSWSVGFGQVPHDVAREYLPHQALQVALCGLVFGFLVLELGSVWPAVIAHAVGNIVPTVREGLPWFSFLTLVVSLAVGFCALGLMRRQVRRRLAVWFGVDASARRARGGEVVAGS
jgi:membrane protease YdiL (CAAX protease family)